MRPAYGTGALSDVVPSLLAGLGVPDAANPLGLPAARRVCLLLVDGLGWRSLREHAEHAPFLAGLAAGRAPITAGFPSTTATSVTSVGTGLPPGEHGLVGYTFAWSPDELVDTLSWSRHGPGAAVDLRERFVPEVAQPRRTALQRAADAGVRVELAAPRAHRDSGLTRAAFRGGEFRGVHAYGDLVSTALRALTADRAFCYAYHAELDLLGHVYGPGSAAWCYQLGAVDRLAATLADGLPPDGLLVVTADHGMVAVPEADRVDLDADPRLLAGVRLLGGEARARHVYAEPGAAADVLAAWREVLGDRAWVLSRAEAVAAGWFGPAVAEHALPRIGDVVAAARGTTALVRLGVEPTVSRLVGQHGSLTPDEQHIPLLTYQR